MARYDIEQTVRLPETLADGRYDDEGKKDPGGRVFIGMGSGICHVWAAFEGDLRPGGTAAMTFERVPGDYINTGNFSAWAPGPEGYSFHAITRKPLPSTPGTKYPEPLERIGPDTTPMRIDEGVWDVEVKVFDKGPDQPPTTVMGVERNHLMRNMLGDEWIVSTYTAPFLGTFEQHGIWGFDPNTGRYHGSWVKTVQSNLGIYEGTWDAQRALLTFDGRTRTCFGERGPDGKVIIVREQRIIRYSDRNTKSMEVWQTSPTGGGEWLKRDTLLARRRTDQDDRVDVNVPKLIDGGHMELVALQHGWQEARVVGRNASDQKQAAAAGLVMLGPGWNAVYGDTLRLTRPGKAGKEVN
jgi:hypothetical protein